MSNPNPDEQLREKIQYHSKVSQGLVTATTNDKSEITGISKTGERIEIELDTLMGLIEASVKEREELAEKRGRVDELIKLADWGKTIDDQWNNHFEQRLVELKGGKK